MFKGLDDIKKKAEQTAKDAGDSLSETTDELTASADTLGEQAKSQASEATSAATEGVDQLTASASEAAESATAQATATAEAASAKAAETAADTTDRARRASGKLKARWSEPETRVEKKFMKELIFFICNDYCITILTVPYWYWNSIISLPAQTPIPLKPVYPMVKTYLHEFWMPV